MLTILTIVLTAFLFIIITLIAVLNKSRKEKDKIKEVKGEEIKQYFKERWKNEQKKFDKEIRKLKVLEEQQQNILDILYRKNEKLKTEIEERENHRATINDDLNKYRESKLSEIEKYMALEEKRAKEKFQREVKDLNRVYAEEKQKIHNKTEELRISAIELIESTKQEKQKELEIIKKDLEDFRNRREAINEEIRKEQEKEHYIEMHSIQLTEQEKEDVHFLLSLNDKIHNKQALYKLIWTQYLQQSYKNTFNNILGNSSPKNVIYCIENIKNGKKYIGKTSAEVSKRWTEHIKTSLNIGTIKSTNIHKALFNHWDDFIFYIVTKTEKDKLNELEKYYISLYASDKYGYNIKAGG